MVIGDSEVALSLDVDKTGTPYAISAYVVVAALVTIGCGLALPDRSRADIEDPGVYRRQLVRKRL